MSSFDLKMVTTFQDNRTDDKNDTNAKVKIHYLPFNIEFDGKANVTNEFSSIIKETEKEEGTEKFLSNQFRGRPMMGCVVVPCNSYSGIVATEVKSSRFQDQSDSEQETKKNFNLISSFQTFTHWNWDQIPSAMDTSRKLMDMLEMVQIIHEPIDSDSEVDASSSLNPEEIQTCD